MKCLVMFADTFIFKSRVGTLVLMLFLLPQLFSSCVERSWLDSLPESEKKAYLEELLQDMSLVDLEGNTYDAETLSASITIINFWASWCPPCRIELPSLVELQGRYSSDQLLVIGINIDSGDDGIDDTRNEFNINFPIVSVDGASIARSFFNIYIPETFIFYKGRFIESHGFTNFTDPSMIETIEGLLSETVD